MNTTFSAKSFLVLFIILNKFCSLNSVVDNPLLLFLPTEDTPSPLHLPLLVVPSLGGAVQDLVLVHLFVAGVAGADLDGPDGQTLRQLRHLNKQQQ